MSRVSKALWRKLLVNEASEWIGTTEDTGHNDGELVRMFQLSVNRYPNREAWCMDFVQFCVNRVYQQLNIFSPGKVYKDILKTESVIEMWDSYTSDPLFKYVNQEPQIGNLIVWRRGSEASHTGHVGIISDVFPNSFLTIEGNTRDRDGKQGVWHKSYRIKNPSERDTFLGYVEPFRLQSKV